MGSNKWAKIKMDPELGDIVSSSPVLIAMYALNDRTPGMPL